ncbi:hypothetical protein GCM10011611_44930 [Aliidongia dinghuensis]|uniref:EAL domain-containing protein n=1 Tax=Aliidongia dinghuensis TaxID=1867774 RepID=A0A8J2YWV0_9PROT|nr:EAL domain-containing protein [Aliidongia dinghuensis]GGF33693.1 hypothetical protein GCM10011611_44930 [Aliidongia dinghuensis]
MVQNPLSPFARRRQGVACRLLTLIVLFSSAVTFVSTGLQLYLDYRHETRTVVSRLTEIENGYVDSLAGSLWNLDVGQLRLQLEGILRLPDMQSLEVRETAAEGAKPLVVSVGSSRARGVIVREVPLTRTESGQTRAIGVLRAEATLEGIYRRLGNTAIVLLLTQGVKTFLVSLFILYIVHRLITRHLFEIADFVDEYDLRAPSPPLRLNRRRPKIDDELDHVVGAFNNMSTGLKRAYEDLREAKDELERDIRVRLDYEQQLLRLAQYDSLTGLPNRLLLHERLSQTIAATTGDRRQAALLCIDLDRFKDINDTLGHAAGDRLLKLTTERLSGCVRETDTLARMGGDEFIVVLPAVEEDDGAQRIAGRIVEAFAQPFLINGQEHFVTASIGITLYPRDGKDSETLLRNADVAMYKAKEQGGNGYRFFTREIDQQMQARLAVEARLRGAVERNEFVLHYQPIVDLPTGRIGRVEALIRWRQPDGALATPDDFVPIAEETGLITGIGNWVIETACAQMREHLLGDTPLARVAVNVSPRQLQVPGFAGFVEQALRRNDLPARCLELEITESVLLDDTAEITANLDRLCALGVRLSIDDFGTGYSSLAYLQRYPFDILKIDRTFVASSHNDNSVRLIETLIAMAHGLGMEVIAEGVETEAQYALLRERDCDHAQGYFFSRPIALDEVSALLRSEMPLA